MFRIEFIHLRTVAKWQSCFTNGDSVQKMFKNCIYGNLLISYTLKLIHRVDLEGHILQHWAANVVADWRHIKIDGFEARAPWTELLHNQLRNVEPSSIHHIINQKKQIINQRDYGESPVMVCNLWLQSKQIQKKKSETTFKKKTHTHNIYIYVYFPHPSSTFLGAKKLVSPDPASSMSSWLFLSWHGHGIRRSNGTFAGISCMISKPYREERQN